MARVLRRPLIAYGPVVTRFENAISDAVGLANGLATTSGTSALHLALLAVGVKPGDLVLVPSLTFVAPANAARYVGAEPILFDSEERYRQLDVERVAAWLGEECEATTKGARHVRSGRRVGAVVPVDLLGHPCDVGRLAETTMPLGIPIVEDAAQALGAKHDGESVGAHADVLCLSFNANKIITTGGGGMLLSNDPDLVDTARHLASQAKEPGPGYVHDEVGFNYLMPSAQAALGLSQLARLQKTIAKKHRIAAHYESALGNAPGLTMPSVAPQASATNWLFTMHVDVSECGVDTTQMRTALKNQKIETRPIFAPLHECGVHAGRQAHECPVAERLASTGLSLPSSATLSERDLDRVCKSILALLP